MNKIFGHLPFSEKLGKGVHRSGWPYVLTGLPQTTDPRSGILIDDFVERTFCYATHPKAIHLEPWIGIFHHPPRMPFFSLPGHRPQEFIPTWHFQRSLEYLTQAIALSEYHAIWMRKVFAIPVSTLHLPTEEVSLKWELENWQRNPSPAIYSFGWYLRNTQILEQFRNIRGIRKIKVSSKQIAESDYSSRVREYWNTSERRSVIDGSVVIQDYVANEMYDYILSSNVVLAEFFDASANNIVVECLSRGTPLICNRLPAIEEYLGSDYPLYFSDHLEIPDLLDDRLLEKASNYLKLRDKQFIRLQTFQEKLKNILSAD